MTGTVLSTLDNGVRTITLNRPERLNAMTHQLVTDVTETFREANNDPKTRVVMFRGAGRAFCSGDDLKDDSQHDLEQFNERQAQVFVEGLQDATREIVLGNTFVVGAIHGWAVGGGFEWALNCDLSLWSEGARAFFPEIHWGMFVTGGVTRILPNLVGLTKAKDMILFGEKFTAAELHDMGVAWKVVPEDRLFEEAEATAHRIAALPERAVRDLKLVMNRAAHGELETALKLEQDATIRGALDPETKSRIASFN